MSTVQYKQEERGTNGTFQVSTLRLLSTDGGGGAGAGGANLSHHAVFTMPGKTNTCPVFRTRLLAATRGRRELCEVKRQPEGLIERKRKGEEVWSGG